MDRVESEGRSGKNNEAIMSFHNADVIDDTSATNCMTPQMLIFKHLSHTFTLKLDASLLPKLSALTERVVGGVWQLVHCGLKLLADNGLQL